MSQSTPPTEAEVREQAYYFWEEDGRPPGREHEYWERATVALAEKTQMDTLTAPPPKKPKSMAAELKAPPKLRSAASKPTKALKVAAPKSTTKLKSAATKAKPVPAKSAKSASKTKKK
jgi:hypothetical protein